MIDDRLIIDGDGHYVEPPEVWTEYLEPAYRGRIRLVSGPGGDGGVADTGVGQRRMGMLGVGGADRDTGVERFVVEDYATFFTHPDMPFTVGDSMTPHGLALDRRRHRRFADSHPGGFSAEARLAVHDAEGIDAAVLFPTLGLFFGSIKDPGLAAAACRAVNRWAADYCSVAPRELYAMANLPSQDPDAAAAELRRAVAEHAFVGGFVLPNPTKEGRRTLGDRSLDVLWSTAEELDVPVCVHGSTNLDAPTAGADRATTFLLAHAVAHPFEQMLAFGAMFQGGVFERHRSLRVGYMESNAGWAPFWLDRLDEHCEQMGWMLATPPTRLPSEIFVEQCVIGCETEERHVPYVQEVLGDDKVLWASDFPHFDCEVPGLVAPMLERTDMTPDQRDGVLRRCSAAFYRLDEEAIRRAVTRRRAGAEARA